MNATDFEKQWGIPAGGIPLTGPSNADRAVEARIGGNLYREEVNSLRRRGHDAGMAGVDTFIAGMAVKMLNGGPFADVGGTRLVPYRAPFDWEAAFDWPIYRAAMVAEVYGALWGQASPSEEVILDTLARCAGLPVTLTPEVIPTCDLCGEQWEDGGEGEDWNGDTGNHQSCEARPTITCADHPGGCGNVLSESELRILHGDR